MIYLAGPKRTTAQQQWNSLLANNLRLSGYNVSASGLTSLRQSDILVLNVDYPDSNSALEFGLASGLEKITIAYCTAPFPDSDLLATSLADAFVHIPFGGHSEIGRAVLGHIKRLQDARH